MTENLPVHGQTSGLNAVMNTLVDAAIVIDGQGKILVVNPSTEEIFGYSADDMVGKNVSVLMPEPYQSEHDSYLGHYIKTGEEKIIGIGREVEGRRQDGTIFPMHLSVGEMGQQRERLFVGIVRDLTEERQREAEFEALQARHFHLSRVAAMNEMGTAIAHEINQPLAATANYIETARILSDRDAPDATQLSEMLANALEQNNRAAEIITRMRTFIERGDVAIETIDLDDVVNEALLLTASKYRDQNIEIVRHSDSAAVAVRGDAVQIQQVLVNLFRNGCEAMENQPVRKLRIDVVIDNDDTAMTRVSVSDTGEGLTPDLLPELFTAFTSTKSGGLGVGLSISRSIVRAHGGRIWATQNPDQGTCFSFTVPRSEFIET